MRFCELRKGWKLELKSDDSRKQSDNYRTFKLDSRTWMRTAYLIYRLSAFLGRSPSGRVFVLRTEPRELVSAVRLQPLSHASIYAGSRQAP